MTKILLLALLATASLFAQPVSVGLKVGVPLTDALSAQSSGPLQYVENTHRYTWGPYVEFHLPARLAIEIDALYRSYNYNRVLPTATPAQNVGSWEFPVLAKYRLLGGPIRPYIEGGLAFSRLTDIPEVADLNHHNNFGIVLGGGLEFHLGLLRISPELRYEGWALQNFSSPLGGLTSNRNQASVLVGIGF
jgi:opacity protein-like surface antigen